MRRSFCGSPLAVLPWVLLLGSAGRGDGCAAFAVPPSASHRSATQAWRSRRPRHPRCGWTRTTPLPASVAGAATAPVSSGNETTHAAPDVRHHRNKGHNSKDHRQPEQRGGGSPPASPDYYDFNAHLNQLAERASDPSHNPIASAARAEEAWRGGMESTTNGKGSSSASSSPLPGDAVSFNTVLKAWRNCGQCLAENEVRFDATDVSDLPVYTASDAAQRALQLLQEQRQQEQQARSGDLSWDAPSAPPLLVDTTSYNIVMDAFVKSRSPHAVEQVTALFKQLQGLNSTLQPDVVSWNALLDAHAYSDREDRLATLQKLLKQMRRTSVRPTVRTLNSVLHAYSRPITQQPRPLAPGSRPQRRDDDAQWEQHAAECEAILQSMKDTYQSTKNPADQPDVMSYTNLIHVLSRRRSLAAAERAEELFHDLADLYNKTGNSRFQPSEYTYTVMILIWARSNVPQAPEKAQEWLQKLLDDPKVQPSSKSYTACIQAWARSSSNVKAAKALQILQQMRASQTAKPSALSYQAALEACCMDKAAPHQQTAALKIAFAVFKAAEQDAHVKVSHFLYAALLKAVAVLLPPDSSTSERDDLATAVFRKACKAGQVNVSVVRALQSAASSAVLRSLLEPMIGEYGTIQYDKIPAAWSKHVTG